MLLYSDCGWWWVFLVGLWLRVCGLEGFLGVGLVGLRVLGFVCLAVGFRGVRFVLCGAPACCADGVGFWFELLAGVRVWVFCLCHFGLWRLGVCWFHGFVGVVYELCASFGFDGFGNCGWLMCGLLVWWFVVSLLVYFEVGFLVGCLVCVTCGLYCNWLWLTGGFVCGFWVADGDLWILMLFECVLYGSV